MYAETLNNKPNKIPSPLILPLSANTPQLLQQTIKNYITFLKNTDDTLQDICATVALVEPHLPYRATFVATDKETMGTKLEIYLTDNLKQKSIVDTKSITNKPKIVFAFAGRGPEWIGMGQTLYAQSPIFRKSIDACEEVLKHYVNWSLVEELHKLGSENRFAEEDMGEPVLFAIEVSLAALWQAYGVEPQAVIGYSMGEIAAAYTAGALSLEDAARVTCTYGQKVGSIAGKGVMGLVNLSATEATTLVNRYGDALRVAIHNSPTSSVLSGELWALTELFEQLKKQTIFCKQVKIDFACHSAQVEAIYQQLLDKFKVMIPQLANVPMYSTVTRQISNGLDLGATYWADHIRYPIQFWPMLETLLADGFTTVIEIGPHPMLTIPIEETMAYCGQKGKIISTLSRNCNETVEFLQNLGQVYCAGYDINWTTHYKPPTNKVDLPTRHHLEGTTIPVDVNEQSQEVASKLRRQLEKSSESERYQQLTTHLTKRLTELLDNPSMEKVELEQGFFELGLNSLKSVILRDKLQEDLDCTLPVTLAFEYPTIDKLATYLLNQVLGFTVSSTNGQKLQTLSLSNTFPLTQKQPTQDEPIAIVGLGCRFPGGVNSPADFWNLLQGGKSGIIEVPLERWDIETYYDPDPDIPGKMYTRAGGFIEDVDLFDNTFFNISPREATYMDPQHRLLLEVGWEALENAGIAPDALKGSLTGVFIGLSTDDYAHFTMGQAIPNDIGSYTNLGAARGSSAGRLAYVLGIHGPTMQIDTACSSSLAALHLACQSLQLGECNMALVGSINLMLSPNTKISVCKLKALAPDGMSKVFDAKSNGFVRGEGCGVVVLKRLSEAEAAGDRILALVRGSAMNHDGASSGFTVPNGQAQQLLLQQALHKAKVDGTDIAYIEAHGTGTPLGDPIEVRALTSVLCARRSNDNPLLLGSVKTNIGHLEAAAGMAGLMKIVLSLQHQEIPPHLNLKQLNPAIDWEHQPIKVLTEHTPWLVTEKPRLAGINSFGLSGTNVHVILQEAPQKVENIKEKINSNHALTIRPLHLLNLSAKTEDALTDLLTRYQDYLTNNEEVDLADVCYTANTGRSHFKHRLGIIADSTSDLLEKIKQAQVDQNVNGVIKSTGKVTEKSKIAFLFTGHGSQYINMGRELYETHPTFQQIINQCDQILKDYLELSLLDVLYPRLHNLRVAESQNSQDTLDHVPRTTYHEMTYAQPILFALQYALSQLWISWGITPDVVMGHSGGEYAAACVAGVFSLEDGLKLVAERGRLMETLPQSGQMMVVFASEETIKEVIAPYSDSVWISVINGPTNIVLSGLKETIAQLQIEFANQEIKTKVLDISYGSHCPLIEPALAEFSQATQKVTYSPPKLKIISNVTGQIINEEIATPEYWVQHLRQPVRFAQSVNTLQTENINTLLEIGPKPALLIIAERCLEATNQVSHFTFHPSLNPKQSDWQQILQSLAQFYVKGLKINWVGFDKDYQRHKVVLPTYPFQRQRHWFKASKNQNGFLSTQSNQKIIHPLVQHKLYLPGKQNYFQSQLSATNPPFLADHRVFDKVILPGTAYLEMALVTGKQILNTPHVKLQDIDIQKSLPLVEDTSQTIQIVLEKQQSQATFEVYSAKTSDNAEATPEWELHTSGLIVIDHKEQMPPVTKLSAIQAICKKEIEVETYYQQYYQQGIMYGPTFQAIKQLWHGENKALGQIELPKTLWFENETYHLHPVLLDACLQVVGAILPNEIKEETFLPIGLHSLQIYKAVGPIVWSYVQISPSSKATHLLKANIQLLDEAGNVLVEIIELAMKKTNQEALLGVDKTIKPDWFYEVKWQPRARFWQPAAIGHPLPVTYLPNLKNITTTLQTKLETELLTQNQVDLKAYVNHLSTLDTLSANYIIQALTQLGWQWQLEQQFTNQQLANQLNIIKPHYRLLDRLLHILKEENILQASNTGWKVVKLPEATLKQKQPSENTDNYPVELALLERCGSRLSAVLCGAQDPLELIFPGNNLSLTTRLYQESPTSKLMNTLIQQSVMLALQKLPSQQGLRILEIGAGTGSTTSYVLKHLPSHQVEYTFTDIGPAFLSKAKEKFATYNFMHYKKLDIEQNPTEQGFIENQYDLIIAANVLHATTNLAQTLSHVKQLLTPGGLLILYEVTQKQRWLDLTFGLLEGWWKFNDHNLRPNYPLLNPTKWLDILETCGFEQQTHLTPIEKELSNQSIILAQKPLPTESSLIDAEKQSGHWLIMADKQGLGEKTAQLLQTQGQNCHLIFSHADYKTELEQLWQHLKEDDTHLKGILYLWGLETTPADKLTEESLAHDTHHTCGNLLTILQSLAKAELPTSPKLWIVTRSATLAPNNRRSFGLSQSPLWGMGKVITLEHPELRCVRIDLGTENISAEAEWLFAEIWASDEEDQIALQADNRYVARLVNRTVKQPLNFSAWESYQLSVSQQGTLDNLQWHSAIRRVPKANEVEIEVKATGLNFLDVLHVLGELPIDIDDIGQECSGHIVAVGEGVTDLTIGDAVVGVATGCFTRYITVNRQLVTKLDTITMREGATIPVTFLTAYYCLHTLANIKAGDKVLIHAATGGTGQAAVQIAQQVGAEVYGTASEWKWDTLRALGVKHIYNSRNLDFATEIMQDTNGEGVDIVLNSLTGPGFIEKNLSILAKNGRFLEISKRNVWTNQEIKQVRPDVSYWLADLREIVMKKPEVIATLWKQLTPLFNNGYLKPLAYTAYTLEDVAEAFKTMQQGKHTGKIVITAPTRVTEFRPEATYLITGGLKGLGLLVARWMIEKGVRHLVLAGRSEPDDVAKKEIADLETNGASITILKADISQFNQVKHLLNTIAETHPPLAGIIHSAGLLADGILQQQTWQNFEIVLAPKVQGSWYLHQLTQDRNLDFFILFSSIASLLGSAGQANHAAANAFLDALAHYRQTQGLVGLSINWGAWSEIGAFARRQLDDHLAQKGLGVISPQAGLAVLENLFWQSATQIGVIPINWSQYLNTSIQSPFFSNMLSQDRTTEKTDNTQKQFMVQLETTPITQRLPLLSNYVQSQVAKVLGWSSSQPLDSQQGFFEMGLDSLTSVELRNKLQSGLNCKLRSTIILDYPSVASLTDYLAHKVLTSLFVDDTKDEDKHPTTNTSLEPEADLENLSEAELANLLAEELEML